ncbi:hypothetical protein SLUN_12055 [Streptomyces lunaelactis]|uniref:Type I restriction modification DNA specificity domain-containing protein n=1 Tax=Streptomyces lunaelactis TaxID=1535768 RepID=A0A2R4T125_9ACTN|nr:restriction endonuclease subunit S [Streptomyces lunaelactis]AVZ72812.1 hypothetical protein SLUN_12055 [Streptomyces lunaelactis]NUK84344.1 restriction endonuclease subunit S [Streptomyces lunaelactis]
MTLTDYAVDDVITLVRRPVLPEADKEYREIGIRSFGNGIFHKEPVPGHEIASKKVFRVEPNDLVFSNVFAWEGAVAIASEAEKEMIGSHRFMTYRVNGQVADARYLLPYFYGGPGLEVIRHASPGSAGRNRTLGIKTFGAKRVTLPDLAEQSRVADKLVAAMSGLDRVNSLMSHAELLHPQILASLVPGGIKEVNLSTVLIRVKRPVGLKDDTSYRFLGVRWYAKGPFVREVKQGREVAADTAYRVEDGDFIYNRLFGWKGSFGCITPELDGAHVSNEFPTFRVEASLASLEYVMLLFRVPALWESALARSSGSTPGSRNRLKEQELLAMKIPLPSLEEQAEIVRRANAIIAASRRAQWLSETSAALRRSLLNAAFAGQL